MNGHCRSRMPAASDSASFIADAAQALHPAAAPVDFHFGRRGDTGFFIRVLAAGDASTSGDAGDLACRSRGQQFAGVGALGEAHRRRPGLLGLVPADDGFALVDELGF